MTAAASAPASPFPDPRLVPADARDWDDARARFRWPSPARCNLADMLVEARAAVDPDRVALQFLRPHGDVSTWTYGALARAAGRLANALSHHGVARGDRVGLLLPQTPEALLAHLAIWKIGAVSVPLTVLFGEDALRHRLRDSGAVACITDAANLPKLLAVAPDLPDLRQGWSTDRPTDGALGFWQELAKARDAFPTADTGPDDPALISYTSGTTGAAKGALHAHRVLIGHQPGFETHHDLAPQQGDRIWTPADWAWLGGLCNVMMPALLYGIPLVAHRMTKFDPDRAWDLMRRLEVRNAFFPPTALKILRGAPAPKDPPRLRTLASGGEALGEALLDWGRDAFGLEINEFYGQTECNLVLGNCHALFPARPGSTGRAVPGKQVGVLGPDAAPLPMGEVGEIAIRTPDPALFLGYWNQPEKTAEKMVTSPDGTRWLLTGDEGRMEPDGHVFFSGRGDDVITSSGYRIGPAEIEDCLMAHPAVAMAAAVGLPDPTRTEIVAAFVTLTPGAAADGLPEALASRVRERLGAHAAPRRVEIVEDLPLGATGKILRREVKRAAVEGG